MTKQVAGPAAVPVAEAGLAAEPFRVLDLVRLVIWLGVLTGLIEVLSLGVIKFGSLASPPAPLLHLL